jgi:hypothetical protein
MTRDLRVQPDQPPPDATSIGREVLRAYRRAAAQLREVYRGPRDGLDVGFRMEATKGGPTTSSVELGERIHRHAVLLRPFMAAGSPVELRSVWAALSADPDIGDDVRRRVDQDFERADHLSFALTVNGRDLSARDVYFAFGEGQYFSEEPEAAETLREIGPMLPLVEMAFHEVCGRFARLVFVLLDELLAWERRQPSAEVSNDPSRCIYCLTEDGDFGPEEHVIPESLIGDQAVLRGSVCGDCNNRLSRLDEVLVSFEPVAYLRTVFGPLTKKGKFPKARFRDLEIERTGPRALRVTAHRRRPGDKPEQLPDGTYSFKMEATGRRRFDPISLGRALFKVGLGLVALQAGPAVALQSRYDAARRYVLGSGSVGTHLLISSRGMPRGDVRTTINPDASGTPVILDLFGVVLAFALEGVPLGPLPDEAESLLKFWLGEPGADEDIVA